MPAKPSAPVTLGEKLSPTAKVALAKAVPRPAKPEIALWRVALWSCCLGFLVWLATGNLLIGIAAGGIGGGTLLILRRPGKAAAPSKRRSGKTHMLQAADKQGFMKNLRLADKTALFDGSNIYHFGMDKGRRADVVSAQVRAEVETVTFYRKVRNIFSHRLCISLS